MLKKLLCSFFVLAVSTPVSADKMRFVGFTESERQIVVNDMNWAWGNAPENNVFFKILGFEMEKGAGTSMANVQQFLYEHFPLVIAERQTVKRCPSIPSKCRSSDFNNWQNVGRSDQPLIQPHLKLYTPVLDRNYETSIFGFSPDKLLSVKDKNQTMAVVKTEMLSEVEMGESNFPRWVRLSQWLALARLHQIFSAGGEGLRECKTGNGTLYLCDPYTNGSMYIASLALLAASEACEDCSENEKLMLKILAFDHIVRTGRGERAEKIVEFLEKDLSEILDQDNKEIEVLNRMLEKRKRNTERGLVF